LVSAIANKITEFIKAITPESVKKFTTAIVNFGFFLARVMLDAIKWVGNFIADIGGVKVSWLKAQKSVVDFGLTAVGVFQQISNAMQRLLGNTADQQLARINEDIIELEETIASRLLKKQEGGLFAAFYDPAITGKMRDDIGLLQAEAMALKAGLVETPEGFLSKEIAATQQFLGGISSQLASEIASAERIQPKIKLKADVEAFDQSARNWISDLEKVYAGEEITKQLVQGRDPELQREILGQLTDMNGKMSKI
jgi:hypothetical protein